MRRNYFPTVRVVSRKRRICLHGVWHGVNFPAGSWVAVDSSEAGLRLTLLRPRRRPGKGAV